MSVVELLFSVLKLYVIIEISKPLHGALVTFRRGFFVRGGYVNSSNTTGKFLNVNSEGVYWSSRAVGSSYAYYFSFGSSSVWPSNYGDNNRFIGRPLRCLIPTP